ncbi:MAG: hypothetical protein VZQ83_08820 [Eubacterium sp.]|nr:hypothetical protein [Eubacterium sp.]
MNTKKRMKKTMSIVLMLTLMLGLFGGVTSGPDSKAYIYTEFGKIYIKWLPFDARGDSYDDVVSSKVYENSPTTLYFKRKTGCRIPKGAYLVIVSANDYDALISEGYRPWSFPKEYRVSTSSKKGLNYNECCWYWPKGFQTGKYCVCLVLPCVLKDGKTSALTWKTYDLKINRYG